MHAGDKNDRRALEARVLVNEAGGFEAVHAGHAHVEQHHRELLFHQALQCLEARVRVHQVLAEVAQDRTVGQQARFLIIDQQNIDLFDLCVGSHLPRLSLTV